MRIAKKHDERLNEILDAAESLFVQKGYEHATINDILSKVGIGKGTFYHYFKSKEDVMLAVIDRISDSLVKKTKAIAEDSSLDAHEKMKRIIFAGNITTTPNSAILEELHLPSNTLMHQTSIVTTVRSLAPIMADVVQQGIREGVYHTPDPLETIEFLLASNQFFFDETIFRWTPEKLLTRVTAFVRIFELALGAEEGCFRFVLDTINKKMTEDQETQIVGK